MAVSGSGGTIENRAVPAVPGMTICGSMILGAFTTGEVRVSHRLALRRMVLMGLQRLLTFGRIRLVSMRRLFGAVNRSDDGGGLDPLHLSVGEC